MTNKKIIWIMTMIILISVATADLDPNRIQGYARIDGAIAPAGTLINITAGGVTVQVVVDDGINVVPAEFGVGQFETDADVPYWNTGDSYLVEDGTGQYAGTITGNLIAGTTYVGILDLTTGVPSPELDATVNLDGETVNLNWTNIITATSYTIYYGTNLTQLENLNTSNVPTGINSVSGIITNLYNDTTAIGIPKRYYRVASVRGSIQNISNPVGKYIYELIASADGTLGRNLVAEPINATLNSKTYLNAIPVTYDPYISKLDRSNPEQEIWIPQIPEQATSQFNLIEEEGYLTFVNTTHNYTFIGRTWTIPATNNLIASTDGTLGRNLVGITYTTIGYNAKSYLAGIPTAYDPFISKLDRSDSEQEIWIPQIPEQATNQYNITEGEGYLAFVNTSYNYTLN